MTSPPFTNVNPLTPEILACPHAFNQQLREQAPVYHCPITDVYFVSDYDNVVGIAKNEKRFSNPHSEGEPWPQHFNLYFAAGYAWWQLLSQFLADTSPDVTKHTMLQSHIQRQPWPCNC